MWRCWWCNGYRRRKWTRRHEFKSWTRLFAFHLALIPLASTLLTTIQGIYPQVWFARQFDQEKNAWDDETCEEDVGPRGMRQKAVFSESLRKGCKEATLDTMPTLDLELNTYFNISNSAFSLEGTGLTYVRIK